VDEFSLGRRLTAEFLGTFILVLAGTGAIIFNTRYDAGLGTVGIGVVFGLAIAAGVYTTIRISAAHFNPAISISMALIGRARYSEIVPYVAAQVAGAVAASALLRMTFGYYADMGATQVDAPLASAFLLEVVITGILAFVIASVALGKDVTNIEAALMIGGAVALGAIVGGPATGGSMNPARSFGPALVALTFADFWIYVFAPPIGAALGALSRRALTE